MLTPRYPVLEEKKEKKGKEGRKEIFIYSFIYYFPTRHHSVTVNDAPAV